GPAIRRRAMDGNTRGRRVRRLVVALAATLVATGGAACTEEATAPTPLPFQDPGAVAPAPGERLASLQWIDVAREEIGRNRPTQRGAFRALAYLTAAPAVAVERATATPGATRPTVRGATAGAP